MMKHDPYACGDAYALARTQTNLSDAMPATGASTPASASTQRNVDRASGSFISGVSGRADGVPNQQPQSRRTEHAFTGASRLTPDRALRTIDAATRFAAREREYVIGLMILTAAFGVAVATWLGRVAQ